MSSRSLEPPTRDARTRGIPLFATDDGCAQHPIIARLTAATAPGRDLADAIHCICATHGETNALFLAAAYHPVPGVDVRWLDTAAADFAEERAYLAALTAAVGPLPSTPGQAQSDSAFAALRHAFEMLATSDRVGCAAGAAIALLIDWKAFRRIFDTAADRFGVTIPGNALPDEAVVIGAHTAPETSAAAHRAIRFGAQQAFAQHRGLLDLIDARAAARDRQ